MLNEVKYPLFNEEALEIGFLKYATLYTKL